MCVYSSLILPYGFNGYICDVMCVCVYHKLCVNVWCLHILQMFIFYSNEYESSDRRRNIEGGMECLPQCTLIDFNAYIPYTIHTYNVA